MENECIICLEPLNCNIALLSCNHKYHYHCIQQWINTKENIKKICTICPNDVEIVNIIENNQNNQNKNELQHQPFKTNSNFNIFNCCNIL